MKPLPLLCLAMVVVCLLIWSRSSDSKSQIKEQEKAVASSPPSPAEPRKPRVAQTARPSRPLNSELLVYLEKPSQFPRGLRPEMVTKEDVPALLGLARATPKLGDRSAAMAMLAMQPKPEVVQFYLDTLTREFNGQTLDNDDQRTMMSVVRYLGFAAQTSDRAFKFLQNAVRYSYWRQVRDWNSPADQFNDVERQLAVSAIKALGISGRAEAEELLVRWSQHPQELDGPIANLAGGIVDGMFAISHSRRFGAEAYQREYFGGGTGEVFVEWAENTPEGKKWRAWSRLMKTGQ